MKPQAVAPVERLALEVTDLDGAQPSWGGTCMAPFCFADEIAR